MLAPQRDLAVVGAVRVAGVDDEPVRIRPRVIDQPPDRRDDTPRPDLVGEGTGDEVVEHVDDDKGFHGGGTPCADAPKMRIAVGLGKDGLPRGVAPKLDGS